MKKRKRSRGPRLSNEHVLAIREAAHEGGDYESIAKKYRTSRPAIAAIARGDRYADVGGPITVRRVTERSKKRKSAILKKRTVAVANTNRPQSSSLDFATLSIDDAARFLQALAMEWPKIRESFLLLDRLVRGQSDE